LAIRLPKHAVEKLGVSDGSEVDLDVRGGALIARPHRKRPSFKSLVARITPENCHAATDWGRPVGREVW
jgi:antitoxin MazE